MLDTLAMIEVGAAAMAGAAVNAIAGGGSLITFPVLVAVGLPPVTASVTNTVAMCPGYLGATLAQRKDLAGQGSRAARILPIAALGGAAGAVILLETGARAFKVIVPFLIFTAAILVAMQPRLGRWLASRDRTGGAERWAALPVGLAAIYGGYFGAGMGVMVLAALGTMIADSLVRINALKQSVSLVVNVTAALVFVAFGPIDWVITIVMAVCAIVGGALGGMLSARVPAKVLRALIVVLGVSISIVYFAQLV